MDYEKLMQSNIHNKTYWVVATEAAIVADKGMLLVASGRELNVASAHSSQPGQDLESLMWRKIFNFMTGPTYSGEGKDKRDN